MGIHCLFTDFADSAWIKVFGDTAQEVLGLTADNVKEIEEGEGGRKALESAIFRQGEMCNRPFQVTLRAKMCNRQGEARRDITCIYARPLSVGETERLLVQEVNHILANPMEEQVAQQVAKAAGCM